MKAFHLPLAYLSARPPLLFSLPRLLFLSSLPLGLSFAFDSWRVALAYS